MKIIDKDFIVGGHKIGVHQAYADIDPAFVPVDPGVRVLPAAFFTTRSFFTLKKRWLPGENKYFPAGGYEVRGEGGETRSYDMDAVILYPETKAQKRVIDAMAPADENAPTRGRKAGEPKEVKITSGKRGRPSLSPEDKAAKDEAAAAKSLTSNGRRGRPARVGGPKPATAPSGAGRGRPKMTEAATALKSADRASRVERSGGLRGRPKKSK
jgi:hypothetical protein